MLCCFSLALRFVWPHERILLRESGSEFGPNPRAHTRPRGSRTSADPRQLRAMVTAPLPSARYRGAFFTRNKPRLSCCCSFGCQSSHGSYRGRRTSFRKRTGQGTRRALPCPSAVRISHISELPLAPLRC